MDTFAPETYTVEFTKDEIHSLSECLGKLRKHFFYAMDNPRQEPLYVVACELHQKVDNVIAPDIDIPLSDYLQ